MSVEFPADGSRSSRMFGSGPAGRDVLENARGAWRSGPAAFTRARLAGYAETRTVIRPTIYNTGQRTSSRYPLPGRLEADLAAVELISELGEPGPKLRGKRSPTAASAPLPL